MELLNGKALFDFNKYLFENQNLNAYNILGNKTITNALIIEWLDSVGIYINILNLNFQSWWYFQIKCIFPMTDYEEENLCKTRQEATKKAIEKAVEIFNAK
jgi:hypothetical protein